MRNADASGRAAKANGLLVFEARGRNRPGSDRIVIRRFQQIGNKLVTPAVYGLDEGLPLAAVSHGPARILESCAQGGVADNLALPQGVEQFVTADYPVAVFDQVHQQVERQRLDVDGIVAAAQFEFPGIER